jgi:hypothetical protein
MDTLCFLNTYCNMKAESQNSGTNGCRRYIYVCKHVYTATESRDDSNGHERIKGGIFGSGVFYSRQPRSHTSGTETELQCVASSRVTDQ